MELVTTVTLERLYCQTFHKATIKFYRQHKNGAQLELRKKCFLNNSSFLQLIFPDSKLMLVTSDT